MLLLRCQHVASLRAVSKQHPRITGSVSNHVKSQSCALVSPHALNRSLSWRKWNPQVATKARGGKLGRLVDELKDEKRPVVTKLTWNKPLDIVLYPDPRLRAENAKVGVFDGSIQELAEEMFTIMYNEPGVGLAAPQVGVNVRLMVFNEAGERGKGKEYILVNPIITNQSTQVVLGEEGCLSFPKIYGDVLRSEEVTVKAQNEKGEDVELNLKGWIARIFQHEYDHLQGALFHDRMVASSLELAQPQLTAMEAKYLEENPGAKVLPPPSPAKPAARKGFGAGGGKKGFK